MRRWKAGAAVLVVGLGALFAGLAAAFTAADDLPALVLVAFIGLLLLWRAPRQTLVAYVSGVAVVVAAFFATK